MSKDIMKQEDPLKAPKSLLRRKTSTVYNLLLPSLKGVKEMNPNKLILLSAHTSHSLRNEDLHI